MTFTISQSNLREAVSGLRVLKLARQKIVAHRCVRLRTDQQDLVLEASTSDEHVEHRSPMEDGHRATQRLLVPFEQLERVARSADTGTLIQFAAGSPGVIAYRSGGVNLELPFTPGDDAEFPDAPAPTRPQSTDLPDGVIRAIHEALPSAGKDPNRTAICSVLIGPGEIVATDGRQLYRRNSLSLAVPPEGVAVPARGFLRNLPASAGRLLWWRDPARDLTFACLHAGAWRYTVPTVSGYPNYRQVLPMLSAYRGPIVFSEECATQALRILGNLPPAPGGREPYVLCEVRNGTLQVRSGEASARFCLQIESPTLPPDYALTVATGAAYLHNALSRGLRSLYVNGPQHPLVMIDGSVTQLWMPLRDAPEAETRQPPRTMSPPHLPQPPDSREESPQPAAAAIGLQASADPVALTAPEAKTAEHDTPNTGSLLEVIQRARDAHRLLGVALSSLLPHAREMQRQQKALERGHEALKRNLRALRAVEV